MMVGPTSLFEITVITPSVMQVQVSGYIQSVSGEAVLDFRSGSFIVQEGISSISCRELIFSVFAYSMGDLGRYVSLSHQLPGGRYEACIEIAQDGVNESIGSEYCEIMEVEDLLFMEPIWPMNGDTISDVRPSLSWTISNLQIPPGQTVTAVLVPHGSGTPASSLANEQPVYIRDGVSVSMVPFPGGSPSLEPGRTYAWQLERSSGGLVLDRTEPWSFTVRELEWPNANKYVEIIGNRGNSIYEVVDQRIYFRYDEVYSGAQIRCTIYDDLGKEIPTEVSREDKGVNAKSVGVNLYELDLAPYGLRVGYYTLHLRDEKGRQFDLKFHIPA